MVPRRIPVAEDDATRLPQRVLIDCNHVRVALHPKAKASIGMKTQPARDVHCRLQVAAFTRTESWKGVSFCTSMDMISGEAIIAQSENCAMDWSSVRLRFLLPCMYLAPALPTVAQLWAAWLPNDASPPRRRGLGVLPVTRKQGSFQPKGAEYLEYCSLFCMMSATPLQYGFTVLSVFQ